MDLLYRVKTLWAALRGNHYTWPAIGIFAAFFCIFEIELDIFNGTLIEALFGFSVLVLSILVGFCFPASFLINCSSIAAVLKKYRKSEEINLHL